jgi:hypothetical protein
MSTNDPARVMVAGAGIGDPTEAALVVAFSDASLGRSLGDASGTARLLSSNP